MRVFALLLVCWKLYEAVFLYLTGQERCWPALNSHLSSALKKEGYVQKNDLPLYLLYVMAYLATNVCSLVFTPGSEVIQEHPILIRWRLNFNGEKEKKKKEAKNIPMLSNSVSSWWALNICLNVRFIEWCCSESEPNSGFNDMPSSELGNPPCISLYTYSSQRL